MAERIEPKEKFLKQKVKIHRLTDGAWKKKARDKRQVKNQSLLH